MTTRIFNTLFNGLASNTTNGEKIEFLKDALSKYNGATYRIYNSLIPEFWEGIIPLNTQEILINYLLNKDQLVFYFSLTADSNLIWGYDTSDFVGQVAEAFNLTDAILGITDTITLNLSFVTTPVSPPTALGFNVYLGSEDTSTDYVSFENLSSPGPASKAILFNSTDTPMTVTVTIKITDFTPGNETMTVKWTN